MKPWKFEALKLGGLEISKKTSLENSILENLFLETLKP
jgi:hypothetical protein